MLTWTSMAPIWQPTPRAMENNPWVWPFQSGHLYIVFCLFCLYLLPWKATAQ